MAHVAGNSQNVSELCDIEALRSDSDDFLFNVASYVEILLEESKVNAEVSAMEREDSGSVGDDRITHQATPKRHGMSTSEHSYNASSSSASTSTKKVHTPTYLQSCEIDHDYIESVNVTSSFIAGSDECLDGLIHLVRQHDSIEKQELQGTVVVEKNLLLGISNAVASCDLMRIRDEVLGNTVLMNHVLYALSKKLNSAMRMMGNRKIGFVSYLMKKDLSCLRDFSWNDVLSEMMSKLPELFQLLLFSSLKANALHNPSKLSDVIPKLGFVYSVVASSFNCELSRVQRIIASVLHDSCADRVVSMNACF